MIRRARSRGFTLVEVLAAVAVLAIALAAILSAMARYADQAGHLRQKTLALWVAHNRLSEIMAEPQWPATGRSNGEVELGGQVWRWELLIQNTQDEQLRRLDIEVQLDRERETSLASLSAFISQSGRP
ncbi:MAG: type II secretion system minor pseudopilin GspI [Gammaproteobacteria bacterium]|jgi:general secretion pathway protein I